MSFWIKEVKISKNKICTNDIRTSLPGKWRREWCLVWCVNFCWRKKLLKTNNFFMLFLEAGSAQCTSEYNSCIFLINTASDLMILHLLSFLKGTTSVCCILWCDFAWFINFNFTLVAYYDVISAWFSNFNFALNNSVPKLHSICHN